MEERSEELWHEKARQLGIVVIIPTVRPWRLLNKYHFGK